MAVTVPSIADKKFCVWTFDPTIKKSKCVGSAAAGTCDGCGKTE